MKVLSNVMQSESGLRCQILRKLQCFLPARLSKLAIIIDLQAYFLNILDHNINSHEIKVVLITLINGFKLCQNILWHSESFDFFVFDCILFLLILRPHAFHHILPFVHFLNLLEVGADHCVFVQHTGRVSLWARAVEEVFERVDRVLVVHLFSVAIKQLFWF